MIIIISIIKMMIIIFKGITVDRKFVRYIIMRRHMQTSLLVCFYACYKLLLDPTTISSDNQKFIIEELMSMEFASTIGYLDYVT